MSPELLNKAFPNNTYLEHIICHKKLNGTSFSTYKRKHNETLLRTLHVKSVYSPFMKIHGPAHQVSRLNGC